MSLRRLCPHRCSRRDAAAGLPAKLVVVEHQRFHAATSPANSGLFLRRANSASGACDGRCHHAREQFLWPDSQIFRKHEFCAYRGCSSDHLWSAVHPTDAQPSFIS